MIILKFLSKLTMKNIQVSGYRRARNIKSKITSGRLKLLVVFCFCLNQERSFPFIEDG
jgi:hypothetical protein